MLTTFTEMASNRYTAEYLVHCQALLETIFTQIVLKPSRTWPRILFPEIGSLCQNLTSIDSFEMLEHLIQIRLPEVLFTLMAQTFPNSIATTTYCLDALCNLVECFQEIELFDKIQAQIQNFIHDTYSALDILENIASN